MDSGEPLILIMMFFEMRKYRRLMVQIKSDDKMQLALRTLTDDRWIAVATRLARRGSWPHSGTSVPARQVCAAACAVPSWFFNFFREDDSDKVVVFEHGDCILARCCKICAASAIDFIASPVCSF